MVQMLRSSERFSDILHIESETVGTNVKQKVADFAKVHKDKEIGEVFFYFTGHGEFVGDEFYYLLSDYQAKKRNQTSLENSELDGIIRSLSPSLFVKVVDACHSGVSYIKTADDFRDYLKSADKKFDKLYFMFSSQAEQVSYQSDQISYFTESILKSICRHPSTTIRYKDVMSFVADEFKELNYQTPLFITQADFTEVMCEVTPSMKGLLGVYIQGPGSTADGAVGGPEKRDSTFAQRMREDAKKYFSKDAATAVLMSLQELFEKLPPKIELAEIYSREVFPEKGVAPELTTIGSWIDQNREEEKYFARAQKEWRAYKTSYGVDERKRVITGVTLTTEMPFKHIRIRFEPNLPNITPEECFVVPLISPTHLRLFWAFSHFEYVDWGKARRIGMLEWSTDEVLLNDSMTLKALIDRIETSFESFILEPLAARWSMEPVGSNDDPR